MADIAEQSVQIVGRELANTLVEARNALEAYADQQENSALLQRCATELRTARGVLKVLEIYGAALLAEEMELVAVYLLEAPDDRRNNAEVLDALMRAVVQLPGYLERVLAGGRDMALLLLPLLNDLRAVRGSALLSEGTLLLLNLKSDQQPNKPPARLLPGTDLYSVARRERMRFQMGLVGWIRGERIDENLRALSDVAAEIEQRATQQPVFQLWWVVGALVEALRNGGLEGSVSIKRLLGLADREIKRMLEIGETRYAQSPPVELLNNLLYYIARSTAGGTRVSAVRKSFRLDELLPVDPAVEAERETLSAPSVKLMQTVAAAIREDLGRVKDVLDIFVRRGTGNAAELGPQVEMLRKIGDTLGVLGLGELRGAIQPQVEQLAKVVSGESPAGEEQLVEIASELIRIEDSLDSHLVRMILPGGGRAADQPLEEPGAEEFAKVQTAVLRECIANLARLKDTITQNIGGTLEPSALDNWPAQIGGVRAALRMLGHARAEKIVNGIERHLLRIMQPGGAGVSHEFLDRLADAVVSLEYYMETLQAGRKEPSYMLDNAERCVEALDHERGSAVPTVEPAMLSATATLRTLQGTATEVLTPEASAAAAAAAAAARAGPPVLPARPDPAAADDAEPVDPELRQIFVEEAREETARIKEHFPVWEQNPQEIASLAILRRSFHTLKGSGRMVGATSIGEFAWSIENLLNRLIDGTLTRSPAIVKVIGEGVANAATMVEAFATRSVAPVDSGAMVRRAHALAAGQIPVEDYTPPAAAAQPQVASDIASDAAAADKGGSMDSTLREIYQREINAHVSTVRTWIARELGRPEPHRPSEDIYRACHTLSGSSKMAEARHGTRLAEPLERWLRKAWASGVGFVAEDLRLLGDCMSAMELIARNLDEGTMFFVSHDALRERLVAAEAALDARIALAEQTSEQIELPSTIEAEAAEAVEAADDTPAAVAAAAPAEAEPLAMDFDPEIAAIFAEEATELLDETGVALDRWTGEANNAEQLLALKRPLHTLKGGARMAGLRSMASLAHELESLIQQVELGVARGGSAARSVLQQGLDELSRMRESLSDGKTMTPATALIGRIHALAQPPDLEITLETRQLEIPAAPEIVAPPLPPPPPPVIVATAPPPAAGDTLRSAVTVIEEAAPVAPATVVTAPPLAEPPAAAALEPLPAAVPEPEAEAEAEPELVAEEAQAAAVALPPGREPAPADRQELARVDADLLDQLLNNAGEVSIGRARLEQQIGSIDFNLGELSRTVTRLKEQLRKLEIETEKQILSKFESDGGHRSDFDPLELDRYSSIQQFSRALAETASDVASIQQLLESLTRDTQNLLQQQARTVTELQNGLMRTRMVPFQRHVQRLSRIVRQAATDTGKQAELVVDGASGEVDRQVLERMLPPFEHMLRNAVVHGIEMPAERERRGKSPVGRIQLVLRREGAEVIVEITDDGGGMNIAAIRDKALALGLLKPGQAISDNEAMQLVLEPGFSTAASVTQNAGRGVGMDVVANEVKRLGGALHMETRLREGTRFVIRLPFTLAITHALVVRTADEYYALPLPMVEGVVRLPRDEIESHLGQDAPSYTYGTVSYRFRQLSSFVGMESAPTSASEVTLPVVLVRAGDHSTAIVAEELVGSREIVVKSVGPQISSIRGISGATILGDGRIVIILDVAALVRADLRGRTETVMARDKADTRPVALVVDDSITVRRVTQRLLERNGLRVLTARDGVEAMEMMKDNVPDVILLDIEMPRMDGYEVAAQVRNDPRLRDIPIIMITSRVGEKHRARAIELGVDDYLGKPYQEAQLLEAIEPLLTRRAERAATRSTGD
jgi:chemosensory pili system protein ChpA (sensor histidine kinase/response regulator)